MKAMIYLPREDHIREVTLEEALSHREEPGALLWLDYLELDGGDIDMLRQQFGFHELAIDDATARFEQRPKAVEFDDHFFMVIHSMSARRLEDSLSFEVSELDVFARDGCVVTVHSRPVPELDKVWADSLKRSSFMREGADRLLYYLLDRVVDSYLDTIEEVEDVIDYLEDRAVEEGADEATAREISDFKRQLIRFRKSSGPLRDAIGELISRDFPVIQVSTLPYLRSVYDHLIRLADMLDTYRDILGGTLDIYLAVLSNRLNKIMMRLTLVATIFMPLTFITGFFGMNFRGLPFGSPFWFWGSLAVMLLTAIWMVDFFRRSKWL